MRIVAFVGPSGTGKSYNAIKVAHERGLEAIIDDGLLIRSTKILAGTSAKSEKNKVQAVKRAIFVDKEQVQAVRSAIGRYALSSLLIIGTSAKMVDRICKSLGLPLPEEYIDIRSVSTAHDIKKARGIRLREGKHVVPVPAIELRPHLTGVLFDLPSLFFRRSQRNTEDKSIVRPAFSYYGRLTFSDMVVDDIINIICAKQRQVATISDVKVRRPADSNRGMVIYFDLVLYYGANIISITQNLQYLIKSKVEQMTSMPVREVNVSIRNLVVRARVEELGGTRNKE